MVSNLVRLLVVASLIEWEDAPPPRAGGRLLQKYREDREQ